MKTLLSLISKIHEIGNRFIVEKLGYLKRTVSDKDNRYTYISLTKKGEDFKPIFEKISNELNDILYKNLSNDEAETLEDILKKII